MMSSTSDNDKEGVNRRNVLRSLAAGAATTGAAGVATAGWEKQSKRERKARKVSSEYRTAEKVTEMLAGQQELVDAAREQGYIEDASPESFDIGTIESIKENTGEDNVFFGKTETSGGTEPEVRIRRDFLDGTLEFVLFPSLDFGYVGFVTPSGEIDEIHETTPEQDIEFTPMSGCDNECFSNDGCDNGDCERNACCDPAVGCKCGSNTPCQVNECVGGGWL